MAEPTPDHLDWKKSNRGPDQGRKVRFIAKIRDFTHLETHSGSGDLLPWITVNKPKGGESESVTITFGDQSASQKVSNQVDFCYEQNEGNDVVFSREVKPLISGVFDGRNATIIAYGARSSGKTYMIKGANEEQGLAQLAMAEMLQMAEDRQKSITMSFYEIFQEHVYDLLDPRRPEVSVREDAQGKVQLKGLLQAPVTSMSEFHKVMEKMATELPLRSHRGIIVHVLSHGEKLDPVPVAKMNFIDLAGYEDVRRKSIDGLNLAMNSKINKSIHALKNVVYSLIANERHVPYRESKLTHMLRDSLGGRSRILMVACLNPSFCQDSIYMASLISRQSTTRAVLDSTKKTKSLVRPMMPASLKSWTIQSVSATARKKTVPRDRFSEKKANCVGSSLKARKLFDEANHLKSEKASCSDIVSPAESSPQKGEKLPSDAKKLVPLELENLSSTALGNAGSVSVVEASPLAVAHAGETILSHEDIFSCGNDIHEEVTSITEEFSHFVVEEGENIDKENNNSLVNEGESPPISARLQELSNNLKQLYYSTPTHKATEPKVDASLCNQMTTDFVELRTPEKSVTNDTHEAASFCSPWQTFSIRSTGVKNKLVEEYLRFLNTAGKEELKKLKGIGEKRASYIVELRKESPVPFKSLDDLKGIGLSTKQIKGIMGKQVRGLFS